MVLLAAKELRSERRSVGGAISLPGMTDQIVRKAERRWEERSRPFVSAAGGVIAQAFMPGWGAHNPLVARGINGPAWRQSAESEFGPRSTAASA